jgi:hypothetical protein
MPGDWPGSNFIGKLVRQPAICAPFYGQAAITSTSQDI